MIPSAETLVDVLRWRATRAPDRLALAYLEDGESRESTLTYAELDRRARALAVHLRECVPVGERALLLHPQGLDYVVAFYGCLYAGVVAVPLYPPANARMLPRLRAIARDAAPAIALATTAMLDGLRARAEWDPSDLRFLATDALHGESADSWRRPDIDADSLAFLQYTSGSTASPKGVMVSHGNLAHNERALQTCWEHTEQSVIASWLPLFHDMGLIGNALQAVFVGAPCILMSPVHFLQRPLRWLQAISKYRVTTSGGPNFAYDLCVSKITPAERAALDLSSWAVAFNGAEPVRHATLDRFVEAFAPCGFRRETFFPGYGLAESTLVVSAGFRSAPPVTCTVHASALEAHHVVETTESNGSSKTLVGCGRAILDEEIAIVQPDRATRVAAGEVGEIWVSSPSVSRGYWRRAEETAGTFGATIAGENGRDPRRFLRTGDLGFLRDGELFVTGRLKDLIIVRGRNHYPQDIEASIETSHPAIRTGGSAAFSISVEGDAEERVVVAAEVDRAFDASDVRSVFDAMRRAVALQHELRLHAAVLLKPGALPKTTSGKVQRHACRSAHLAGELDAVASTEFPRERGGSPARTVLERDLAAIWARVLEVDDVSIDDDFFRLGGDSLRAAEVLAQIRSTIGLEVPIGLIFENPTLAGLAARLDAMRTKPSAATPPLVPLAEGRERPLSFAQQRLWFLDHLDPGSALYAIPVRVHLDGPLDSARLERSLNAVVRRHEALRTAFPTVEGRPVARVSPELRVDLPLIEVRDADEVERLAALEARRPFDLASGPLVRATLYRRGSDEHDLLLTMHHIVSDGWSVGVLLHEIAALYEAGESAAPLPPLPLQYADFAAWQRECLRGAALDERLDYWRERLDGAPVLALPTDRPRPAAQSHRGAREAFGLPAALVARLEDLGRNEGATLFMTFLAAFDVLLHRYGGQDDVCVGTALAARDRREFEGLIGFFANTLVMRVDLSGDPTFDELLARVRDVSLGAFAHPDLPFEKLVDSLGVERSLSHEPLFQVMLVLQNAATPPIAFDGLRATTTEVDRGAALVDLSLAFLERDGGLDGTLEYATDLFDRETVRRLIAHFRAILDAVVTDPGRRISKIPLLSETERHAVLDAGRGAKVAPAARRVHDFFEVQAARSPDAVAVVDDCEVLTYGALDRRANRLANRLLALGVGPGARVALCLDRSVEFAVAMLATMKAGGAYVPLDPTYPKERLAFLVKDSKPRVIVTRSGLESLLPKNGATLLSLDAEVGSLERESDTRPDVVSTPSDLAYVIYTSGSTGTPKGVMVEHRGVANAIEAAVSAFDVRPGNRVAQLASTSFDASALEILTALAAGAEVRFIDRDAILSPDRFAARLRDERVSHLIAISPTLLGSIPWGDFPDLATIVVGGEACGADNAARWSRGRRFVNAYGPTEASIFTTVHEHPEGLHAPPAIGRPIRNARVVLLDAGGEVVPVGVPGEICIGGVGVARGYLGRPDLTAERFVPDPFSREPQARLYRTGDLARWRSDGALEYCGRVDDQMKVRGFRVEPGEIESALSKHDAVRASAVIVREDHPGDKRLVAYLVKRDGASPSTGELRRFLATTLPEHMLPASFVFLDALPRTPNGKLDRRALPAPATARPALERAFEPPRSAAENALAAIWTKVLRIDRVGIHDNFFELGGDSILAVQIVAAARKAGLALTTRQIFERQTIGELADVSREVGRGASGIVREVAGAAPLTPIQRWFFERKFADPHHWNQAVLLEVDRSIGAARLESALQRVAEHHDAFRLRFTKLRSAWQQVHAAGSATAPFTRVDLSGANPRARQRSIESTAADLQSSLDLARGPLVRAAWFDLGPGEPARLFLVAHHLVVDGVSWRILLDDLAAACEALRLGGPVELPAKTASFSDWARGLDALANSNALEDEQPFWLADASRSAAPIPTDVSDGANSQDSARTISASLDRDETRALLQETPSLLRARVDEILLAALAEALSTWTGSRRLRVDVERHGREPSVLMSQSHPEIDLTRTVGWFTALFPLFLDLSGARGPAESLASVKRHCRAVPRHGIGYGLLRYARTPRGSGDALGAMPPAEILFNYLGQLDSALPKSSPFRFAAESIGPSRAPTGLRTHLIEVNASVSDDALRVEWTYGERRHRRATIERLAERHLSSLRAIVAHGRTAGGRTYDPADFPDVDLDPIALAKIVETVTRGKKSPRR